MVLNFINPHTCSHTWVGEPGTDGFGQCCKHCGWHRMTPIHVRETMLAELRKKPPEPIVPYPFPPMKEPT